MNYVPLARCDQCLSNRRCVRLKIGFVCDKCLALAVAMLVNERTHKKHRREHEQEATERGLPRSG